MSSIRVAVDFYATLGVSHRATTKNINDAYQKLALKHHPDKAGTDAASLGKFQRIYEAVDTLRDPDRRRRYDHLQGIDKRDSRYEAGCARGTVYVDPWSMETLQPCCDPSEEKPESTNTYTLEIWEADYAGIDPELEKAKEKMRKEAMQQEGLDETTGNETDVELEDGEEGVELDQATEYATAEFCFHNGDVCDCYRYLFTDLTLEDDEGSGCLAQDSNMETTDDDESNNRLNIHQSDEVAEVHLDTNANAPLDSLRAYFQAKRIDGRGHYTTEDMHAKLHCMVLGTFCGWLEGARLSFPNAQPVSSQSDPHSCSHVGSWIKRFDSPRCEFCYQWLPICVLTCPGRGIQACVRYNLRDIRKSLRRQIIDPGVSFPFRSSTAISMLRSMSWTVESSVYSFSRATPLRMLFPKSTICFHNQR